MGLQQSEAQSELILAGTLSEFDVSSLLMAFGLGRQQFTLEVIDAAGQPAGSIGFKGGRVLAAAAGERTGAEAVHHLLSVQQTGCFRVHKHPHAQETADEGLGPIVELTRAAATVAQASGAARARVLEGVLSDKLEFVDVLRAASVTRQYLVIEVSDPRGYPLGAVHLKAGRILSAQAGTAVESEALQQLVAADAGSRFMLFAHAQDVAHLRPLGLVTEVLPEVAAPGRDRPNPTNGRSAHSTLPSGHKASGGGLRQRVMGGHLNEFALRDLLRVLSAGRQYFEVHVLDTQSVSVGIIELKAGMLVDARAGTLRGSDAVRQLLESPPHYAFTVIRRVDASRDLPQIAPIRTLLAPEPTAPSREPVADEADSRASAAADAAADAAALEALAAPTSAGQASPPTGQGSTKAIDVLEGDFAELDMRSVVQVAGISRQHTCVRIFDDRREPVGEIHLKGGYVLRAQAQNVTGIAAVRRMLHCPRDFSFVVQRYPQLSETASNIGSISDVLAQAGLASTRTPAPSSAGAGVSRPQPMPMPMPMAAAATVRANGTWLSGAVLGAGCVLLGAVTTALLMSTSQGSREVATDVSPMTASQLEPTAQPERAEQAPTATNTPANSERAETTTQTDEAVRGVEPTVTDADAPLGRPAIASIQAGLKQLGYDTGPIDGVIGPRTLGAIKAFQYAEHLVADGKLTAATRVLLSRRIGGP